MCTADRKVSYDRPYISNGDLLKFKQKCFVTQLAPGLTLSREISGSITRSDKSGSFSADLNDVTAIRYEFTVAYVSTDYSFAIVGNSDRSTFFIQSRNETLPRSTLAFLENASEKLGFDTSHIVVTQPGDFNGFKLSVFSGVQQERVV